MPNLGDPHFIHDFFLRKRRLQLHVERYVLEVDGVTYRHGFAHVVRQAGFATVILDEQIERSINSLEFRGYTYKQL